MPLLAVLIAPSAVVELSSWLDLSLTGIYGILPGGDRYGALFGFSPHFGVWNPESPASP